MPYLISLSLWSILQPNSSEITLGSSLLTPLFFEYDSLCSHSFVAVQFVFLYRFQALCWFFDFCPLLLEVSFVFSFCFWPPPASSCFTRKSFFSFILKTAKRKTGCSGFNHRLRGLKSRNKQLSSKWHVIIWREVVTGVNLILHLKNKPNMEPGWKRVWINIFWLRCCLRWTSGFWLEGRIELDLGCGESNFTNPNRRLTFILLFSKAFIVVTVTCLLICQLGRKKKTTSELGGSQ